MSPDSTSKDLHVKSSTSARITAQSGPATLANELRKSKRNLKRRNNGDLLTEENQEDANHDLTGNGSPPLTSTPYLASLSVPAAAVISKDYNHLFAPAQASAPSLTPPDLSLPDLPFLNSSSPPASPSPHATQNTRETAVDTPDTPRIHEMLMDGENMNTPTASTVPNTPAPTTIPNTPAPPAAPITPIALLQEVIVPPLNDDDDEPDTTPIGDHLAGNTEHQPGFQNGNTTLGNPMEKYMTGLFPPVHDAHPTAIYNNVKESVYLAWDTFPVYKLVAIPFGYESKAHHRHGDIKRSILSAVAEITKSQRVGISAPAPEERIKTRARTPCTFLVHGLAKEEYQTLLKQRIWCSTDITFRIATTKPHPPDLLFSLTEFASLNTEEVYNMVLTVWSKDTTISTIQNIVKSFPHKNPNAQPNYKSFLATLKVDLIKIREKKGRINPVYNIYTNGKYFREHELWSQIRTFLLGLRYGSAGLGIGIAKSGLFQCSLCHGVDHPRGLCPFLLIQGWRGPLGLPEGVNA